MSTLQTVSWNTYAQKYDMLLSYNPYYQQLHQTVLDATRSWDIQPGDQIADIGAGTGNYSLSLARLFHQAMIFHVDNDKGMNEAARIKREQASIANHYILDQKIEDVNLPDESLKALVSIHALYTFPDPKGALRKMHDWLEPGGEAILVDAGRIINVLSWQLAIGWHLLRTLGWQKTRQLLREGREVSRQNAYIRQMQIDGTFWTHSHEEFCETVKEAGFEIIESGVTFRGCSDWVRARKRG